MKQSNGAAEKGAKRTTKTKKAGLIFPVGRIKRQLKNGHYAARISESAAVTLAACVEFMVSELGDMSLEQLGTRQHKRITPRILTLAVKGDSEFSHLFKHVTISEGGVRPTPGV